jgi:ribosomal protein L13
MKRITTSLILCLFFLTTVNAQNPHPFELGFNGGAAWLKSDVKTGKLGSGLGLTFGQTYCMNKTSPLLWGWRFRYLNANTYGQDSKRSSGIANNEVYNGSDTLLDYYHNGGFVYHNYKTHIDELSLEILLGANRLRERTNLYPYIFAGAGLTKAVAKTNQLDDNNQRYDYSKIDSAGTSGRSEILTQLNNMSDGSYESLADGNLRPTWKFMPSFGVGLGFEIIKGFSIGLEHKMTWAFNDVLDGQRWSSSNSPTGTNDMYHYSSVWLKFSFGRGSKGGSTSTATTETTTLANTNTAPAVTFTNPPSSPFNTASPNMTVLGKITNINSISDMTMTMNGVPVTGFTYNSSSQIFNYPANLQSGANTFVVTATNAAGSANATATVVYSQPVVASEIPPVVNITFPGQNPYTTNQPGVAVSGTVMNINSKSQMQMMMNGVSISNFTYNSSTHAFNTNQTLIQGANTFVVTATNSAGSDSKTITVIGKQEQLASIPPPVVTITNPAANPYTTTASPITVNATILNITAAGQIEVLLNGGPIPASKLNYNLATHQLSFNPVLVQGANTIEVSATNVSGRDSKTETVIYNKPQVATPPVVTITNPGSNPYNTTTSTATVNASVLNISSAGQISVTLNGGPIPTSALNYNLSSNQLTFTVNLIEGANMIVVAATNISGNDSKSQTIVYTKSAQIPAPVVTIINPSTNPFNTTNASAAINATVLNITSAGQISVLLNGGPLPASALNYNLTSHLLTFNANLIQGANTVVVSATNVVGGDSKTVTIIYTKSVQAPPPVVTITSPSTNPFNTTNASATVNANVLNITSAGQISVLLNGGPLPASALNYNLSSHQLTFNVNLIQGANTVVVSATNTVGSDSKTETIIYTQPVQSPAPIVTITSPAANPFNTTTASSIVNATVLNITSAGQISVMLNGGPLPAGALNYNLSSHQLTFNANLIPGANTIVVSATNTVGTDSKTKTIIYTQAAALNPPVITIASPNANPFNTSNTMVSMVATVLNVIASGQITVTVNGTALSSFVFNPSTQKLSFKASLIPGSNTIVISASNADGSDSKTQTVNYTLAAPVVSFLTPASGSASVTTNTFAVSAKATNIVNAGQIVVKVNGAAITGFTFQALTKKIDFTANLISGNNTVVITATNASGTDSKTANIIYTSAVHPVDPVAPDSIVNPGNTGGVFTKPVNPDGTVGPGTPNGGTGVVNAPQILLLTPASTPATTTNALYMVTVKTPNVTNSGAITVKINGAVFSGVTYNNKTKILSIPAPLNMGPNTIVIDVANAGLTESKTLIITRQ